MSGWCCGVDKKGRGGVGGGSLDARTSSYGCVCVVMRADGRDGEE